MKLGRNAGNLAAALGVSAVLTAGYSWLEVLLGWSIGAVLCWCAGMQWKWRRRNAARWIQILIGILLIAGAAQVAEQAFPEDRTFPFVSLCMLLLLWYGISGTDAGRAASNAMGMLVLPLMALIVIFGGVSAQWTELAPKEFSIAHVGIAVLVSLLMTKGRGGRLWGWFIGTGILAVGLSVVTQGALGQALVQTEKAPLFRAVQTIRIFGKVQRIEAILAAGTLIGTFSAMLIGGEYLKTGMGKNRKRWTYLLPIAAALGLESAYRSAGERAQSVMAAVFWGILAVYALGIVILEKNEKHLDKWRMGGYNI